MKEILTFICILMMYLGFAGVLGAIMRSTRQNGRSMRFLFLAVIVLPISISLPWLPIFKVTAWILAALITFFLYKQPVHPIITTWIGKFGLIYFGCLMIFILLWSLVSNSQISTLLIGVPAVLAIFACGVKFIQIKRV